VRFASPRRRATDRPGSFIALDLMGPPATSRHRSSAITTVPGGAADASFSKLLVAVPGRHGHSFSAPGRGPLRLPGRASPFSPSVIEAAPLGPLPVLLCSLSSGVPRRRSTASAVWQAPHPVGRPMPFFPRPTRRRINGSRRPSAGRVQADRDRWLSPSPGRASPGAAGPLFPLSLLRKST